MKDFSLKTHSQRSGVINSLFRMLTLSLFVLCTTVVFAQQKTIKGIVVDATGEPLIGVNVSVKGTTIGIITDIDGKYTLEVPTNATLVFSYIGYRTQELSVGNQTTINITMQEDTQNIDEVVVVGYGVQKKETVTGSVSTLKGDDLVKSPVANLSNAIAGKMSGVVTYQRSGEPGYDGATIRIRGSNTLGNNDPLIVIDGVAARAGGLERLDPNEIETMSVLKDASAAIYGARAANGVILITTKKGRAGKKPEFTYSFNQGWSKPTNLPEMCDAVEYSELMNELYMNKAMLNPAKNNGQTMGEYTLFRTPEEIELYRNGNDPWRYPNTDWYAATFKNWSPQRVHNASLEGGSDKYQYFVNFGHKYTDGLYHKSANNYKQFNLRMNVDAQFNDYIKVGAQLMGRQENRNFPSQGAGDLLWFTSQPIKLTGQTDCLDQHRNTDVIRL